MVTVEVDRPVGSRAILDKGVEKEEGRMTPLFLPSTAGMVVHSKQIEHRRDLFDESHEFGFGHVEELFHLFVLFSNSERGL